MLEGIKKIANICLGLILIALVSYSAYRVLKVVWHSYKSLSVSVQIAIAVAVLSLFSTFGSLIYSKVKDRKLQIQASNTAKKQTIYDQYVKDIIGLIASSEKGNDDEYTKKLRVDFISNAILWADREVLDAYHSFRVNYQADGSGEQVMWDFATLFLAFRKNLGLSNKSISQTTIAEILYDKSDLESFYSKFVQKKDSGSDMKKTIKTKGGKKDTKS
jgi:hypothetical protein